MTNDPIRQALVIGEAQDTGGDCPEDQVALNVMGDPFGPCSTRYAHEAQGLRPSGNDHYRRRMLRRQQYHIIACLKDE
jgi:hypothetical protein